MSGSLRVLAVLLFFAGLGVGVWFVADRLAEERAAVATARYEATLTAALDDALARQDAAVAALSQRFETVDDLKTAQERRLRQYFNAAHVATAQRHGVGRVGGEAEIERLVAQGRLVPIEENPLYRIQPLDYSVPYVTPATARLLDTLGARFQRRLTELNLPRYRYVVSSVLRTAENQAALRQINPNATFGVSSHEFGTTLDIVFHTYDYVASPADTLAATGYAFLDRYLETSRQRAYDALGMRYWQELQGVLGRELIALQEDGRVVVLLEREQPVFHLTAATSE